MERTANYDEKDWSDEVIQRLAALELNGRQIKNVIRTANTLALAEKKKISMQEIQDVLDTVLEFQRHVELPGLASRKQVSTLRERCRQIARRMVVYRRRGSVNGITPVLTTH